MSRAVVLSPTRLRALVVLAGAVTLAVGVIAGQVARRAALFDLRDARWERDAVTVGYGDGNDALAIAGLVVVLAVVAGGCWWLRRFAVAQSGGAGADRWTMAVAAVWTLSLAGAVGGWATTSADDGITAPAVAGFLRDVGDDVEARIVAGESDVVRPGGVTSSVITAPAVVEFELDGSVCSVVVDDPLVGDGGTLVLPALCS